MRHFQYRALDQKGSIVSGTLGAANHTDLKTRLAHRKLSLLSCRRLWRASISTNRRVKRGDLLAFTFHIQQLLAAGVPLLQALDDLRNSATSAPLKTAIEALRESIDAGLCLSDACRQQPEVFDALYCSLIEIGETSGRLSELFGELAELLKWQDETAAGLRKVMIYPAFVAVVLLAVILFVMTFLVPSLISFVTSTGSEIPWHTRLLIDTSNVIAASWIWLLLAMMGLALAVPVALARMPALHMIKDKFLLQLPMLGAVLYRIRIARFSRCAALMYGAGIGLPEVLKLGAGVVNSRVIGGDLLIARKRVFEGVSVTDALRESGQFTPLVISMVGVGETTGALDNAFRQISYFYDRQARDAIDRLEQSLGPCLIVVVGAIMLWVVVSVVGPIYDLVFDLQGS